MSFDGALTTERQARAARNLGGHGSGWTRTSGRVNGYGSGVHAL